MAATGYVKSNTSLGASAPDDEAPPQPDFLMRASTAPGELDRRVGRRKINRALSHSKSIEGEESGPDVNAHLEDESRAMVWAQVQDHPACDDLDDDDIDRIVNSMRQFSFSKGTDLMRRFGVGQYFFVITEGVLNVDDGKGFVETLGKGESFGGHTMLFGGQRSTSTTVVVKEDARLWRIAGSDFREVLKGSAQKRHAENFGLLDRAEIFNRLDNDQKAQLGKLALFTEAHDAGDRIVLEGQVAAAVYFVKTGSLSVFSGGSVDAASNFTGGTRVRELRPGDSFGKQAALNGRPSRGTIVADTACKLVCVGIKEMKEMLGTDIQAGLERSVLSQCLEKSNFLSQFSIRQRRRIVDVMTVIEVEPGAPIEEGLELIAVARGSVSRSTRDGPIPFLEYGDFRETDALMGDDDSPLSIRGTGSEGLRGSISSFGRLRSSRVSAASSRSLLDPDELTDLVGGPEGAKIGTLTQEQLNTALREAGLTCRTSEAVEGARRTLLARKVPLFHHLSEKQIDEIVESFIFVQMKRDEVLFDQGSAARDFWVITSGEVEERMDDHPPRTIGKNGHFGIRALLLGMARNGTVTVTSDEAEFWQLEQETFEQIVTGNIREELVRRCRLQDTKVELKALRPIRVIGQGGFGSVRMVEHCQDPNIRYALKRIKKKQGGEKILTNLKNECELLRELNHPLIMLLVQTFETIGSMYILSELITGGDLFAALDNIKRLLQPWEARFYVGSLVLVLEFLSDRFIVFRDLKPENVMLDNQGYIKLIDFGTAKKLAGVGSRTYTVIGSYQFMAPEVSKSSYELMQKSKSSKVQHQESKSHGQGLGYGTESDIFSLGVMFFEFVCGYLPFAHDIQDPSGLKIVQALHESNLEFPKWYGDREGKHIIRGMLRKDPTERLGAGANGYTQIREHAYFNMPEPTDSLFDLILGRQLDAPYAAPKESYQFDEEDQQAPLSDADVFD